MAVRRTGNRRQLRLALAMRGGVSLAVWIGGACAEIERCRQSGDETDATFWQPLLDAAGFDDVAVDVLAGASAGGLNGALLATSLVYGVDFSRFRDVWLQVAGLRTLLGPPRESAVSILRGDYFLDQLREQLRTAAAESGPSEPAPYVDLHLAATATAARPVAVADDAAGWFCEGTYRAGFRFRHNQHTSDFLPVDGQDGPTEPVLDKLALAARASSSFPGAFAPARVEVAADGSAIGQRGSHAGPSLRGIFSDPSGQGATWIVDGGVLDNIPVGRAIQSIAEAPASQATERWLLYLCPSPDDLQQDSPDPAAAWDGDGDPDLLWTIRGVLRAGGSRETILEDMVALREHNDRAARYAAARELLLSAVLHSAASPAEALLAAATGMLDAAAANAATREAQRLRALVEDPVAAFGEDPFPPPAAGGGVLDPSALRLPLASTASTWTRPRRDALEAALRTELRRGLDAALPALLAGGEAPSGDAAAALGPAPVGRAARYLIGQIGLLERSAPASADTLGHHKAALYALADASDLVAHVGDLLWPVLWTLDPPAVDGVATWGQQALRRREAFLGSATAPAAVLGDELAAAGLPAEQAAAVIEAFAVLRAELRRRLATADGEAADAAAQLPPGRLVASLWQRLVSRTVDLAADLAAADLPLDDLDAADALSIRAFVQVMAELAGAPEPDQPGMALRALVALDVVMAPLQQISAVPLQPISFVRVSGAAPTDLPFDALSDDDGGVPVARKLCGNALANFAAFYRQSWRANDWMWGRMDAVDGLLHVLLNPERLRRQLTTSEEADAFVETLQRIVTAPFSPAGTVGEPPADWAPYFAQRWADAEVAAEITQLRDGEGTDLPTTRQVLRLRRAWEIAAAELPAVARAQEGDAEEVKRMGRGRAARRARRSPAPAPPPAPPAATPTRATLDEQVRTYAVGLEALTDDLGQDHLARLAADALLATWSAGLETGKLPRFLRRWVGAPLPLLHWLLVNRPRTRRWVGLGPPAA